MGFTCILETNNFLVGRYWDFKRYKKVDPLLANFHYLQNTKAILKSDEYSKQVLPRKWLLSIEY